MKTHLSTEAISNATHVLAAHYWLFIREMTMFQLANMIKAHESDLLSQIRSGNPPPVLARAVDDSAETTERIIKTFISTPNSSGLETLQSHRTAQLSSWTQLLQEANGNMRYNLIVRAEAPLMRLPREEQDLAYKAAREDLKVAAAVCDTTLPDPLPLVQPLDGPSAILRNTSHRLGMHNGIYAVVTNRFNSVSCQLCNVRLTAIKS